MSSNVITKRMDWTGCVWVESIPGRMHGTPVVLNSRMDADGVLLNADEGMSAEEIAEEFGSPVEAVMGVLEFARRSDRRTAA